MPCEDLKKTSIVISEPMFVKYIDSISRLAKYIRGWHLNAFKIFTTCVALLQEEHTCPISYIHLLRNRDCKRRQMPVPSLLRRKLQSSIKMTQRALE